MLREERFHLPALIAVKDPHPVTELPRLPGPELRFVLEVLPRCEDLDRPGLVQLRIYSLPSDHIEPEAPALEEEALEDPRLDSDPTGSYLRDVPRQPPLGTDLPERE